MTEFQELTQDAPNFVSMERGELVAYAYGMFAAGTKSNAENAKLRKLVRDVYTLHWSGLDCTECPWFDECDTAGGCPWLSIFADRMCELGVDA